MIVPGSLVTISGTMYLDAIYLVIGEATPAEIKKLWPALFSVSGGGDMLLFAVSSKYSHLRAGTYIRAHISRLSTIEV